MKTRFNPSAGGQGFGCRALLALAVFLLAIGTASAQTPYTSTGWVTGVPVPSIVCPNAAGRVLFRGNAHTVRVESSDPRLTGNRVVFVNGAYQADGTALLWGDCYQQVGTWDSTGTNFTATGGLWEISFRGVMQTDYTLQASFAGSGLGGSIEGLRIEETMTRAAAAGPIDPAVPYHYSGRIKPPPVDAHMVLDDFNDNAVTGWFKFGSGVETLIEANQQLTVRGEWPGMTTLRIPDTYAWGTLPVNPWNLAAGRFMEWQVDLVGMNDHADMAALCTGNTNTMGIYLLFKWRGYVGVGKWVGNQVALLSFAAAPIRNSNVTLVLAQTLVNDRVVLLPRVLDRENGNTVLYQGFVEDTPAADPTVSTAQVTALSGMHLTVGPDLAGTPYTTGNVVDLECWQYNDGTRPPAEVMYDNLAMRTYEVPSVGIEPTMRLTWPDAGNYAVECAPTVQGPWMPLSNAATPGFQQLTVPANQPAAFYRLRPAP